MARKEAIKESPHLCKAMQNGYYRFRKNKWLIGRREDKSNLDSIILNCWWKSSIQSLTSKAPRALLSGSSADASWVLGGRLKHGSASDSMHQTTEHLDQSLCLHKFLKVSVELHPSGLQGPVLAQLWDWRKSPEQQRDINGLKDGGAYTFKARSCKETPPCTGNSRQDMVSVFAPGGWEGRLPVIGGVTLSWLISYQGNHPEACLW